jgi:hypothetical protein
MKISKILSACLVVISVGILARAAQATTIVSTFDSGLDGWGMADTLGSTGHVATGGNPGGYFWHDNSEFLFSILLAPAAYLGNLSSFVGGTFSFDGIQLGNGGIFFDGPHGIPGGYYLDYGTIQIVGSAGTAQVDLLPNGATPLLGSWQSYSIALTGGAWGLSDAAFAAILSDVTALTINIEGLWGAEVNGIDNVRLISATDDSVPDPGALALLGLGLFGIGGLGRKKPAA